jgi:hypothetical protein
MIAPRFSDTIDADNAVVQAPAPAGMPGLGWVSNPPWGENPGQLQAMELSRHFKYWAYICIHRIGNIFAESFPCLSWPTTGQPGRRYLTSWQKAFLQKIYGRRWLQSVDDDLEPVPDTHPLYRVMQRVNSEDTWFEFAYETCLFLYLMGKFYWWLIPSGLRGEKGLPLPAEFWVIPTQWVREIYAKSGTLIKYQVVPDSLGTFRELDLPPEEVVWGKFKSPRSKIDGFSPLMAAPLWPELSEIIERSRGQSFKNGVNPDLIVKLGQRYANPTQEDLTRIKERFLARAAGVIRTGEPLLVPPDIDVEKWTTVPKEMDYPQSAEQLRNSVLALFGVPPIIAGMTTDYNRATADAAMVVFAENVLNPLGRLVAGVLTEKVASRYDPTLRVWYEDWTPRDAEFWLKKQQFAADNGAYSPDDIRRDMDLDPYDEPWSESPYMAMGKRPLSEDAQPEPEPQPAATPAGESDAGDDSAE